MKNVLYIGNALSNNGSTRTVIEELSAHLKDFCSIKVASQKSNKLLRLMDMALLVLKNKSETDFVLIDTYSTLNFYYALVISQLCRFLRIKYITILHGGDLENRLKNNPSLCQFVFSNAHKIVAPSNFLKSVFKTYGYEDVIYIPNGIALEKYAFKNRPIDHIHILWVRSFSSIYNPELAVLVLERLLKMNYQATLTMIGPDSDGSLNKTKALATKKNLNVVFTGMLAKKEWIDHSKKCNVFINTTNVDNTPVSVIEAMALGLPVVSTNVGGLPFLIQNNRDGFLVEPKDVEAMVDAIIKLKSDEEVRSSIIIQARSKVENFSWKVILPVWKSLLS